MRAVDVNPIDGYLRSLDRRLTGPARLRADLLAEARGGLEDAAAAYAETGLDPTAARRRAVAEFGAPGELASAYQAELAATYGRRLGVLLALLPVAMLVSDTLWWRAPADTGRPSTAFLLVAETVDWAVYAAGGLALVCLVLLGRRRGPDPRPLARLVGATTLVATVAVWALGAVAATSTVLDTPTALAWPPMLLALVCLNGGMGYLLFAGARCVRAGRTTMSAS